MAMSAALSFPENSIIKPSIEIGAFEALWSEEVSSFKQLREKMSSSPTALLSNLIETSVAKKFYQEVVSKLRAEGIDHYGVRLSGTIDFPPSLYDADYPVALLYYRGNWDLAFTRGISVVGTRTPSHEGIRRTEKLVKLLVGEGFTIYSGLAAGIDTIAHEEAIDAGGSTVAVIGTPLWHHYPKDNALLQEKIANNHLLISQVPILSYEEKGIKFNRIFFPERNKTMSALTEATIIVEAGDTSGTLIQAKAALKQRRKVFILNNNFENPRLTWPHQLQKAGAIRIYDINDLLQELSRVRIPITKG